MKPYGGANGKGSLPFKKRCPCCRDMPKNARAREKRAARIEASEQLEQIPSQRELSAQCRSECQGQAKEPDARTSAAPASEQPESLIEGLLDSSPSVLELALDLAEEAASAILEALDDD